MKANKFLLILCSLQIGIVAYSQYNLNFDADCLKHNSAILSQTLIEVVGKDEVTNLLESKLVFSINFTVDSLGYVKNINRTSLKFPKQLNDSIKIKIIDYLVKNKRRFFICYDIHPEKDKSKMYKIITEDYRKSKEQLHAYGGFPLDLSFYNSYKWYLEENPKKPLTIFEYLQKELKKYLLPPLNVVTGGSCTSKKSEQKRLISK